MRTLPARERGPSKDVYVVVDWRPLKDEDTDTSAKKAKYTGLFDTSPKKLSAVPEVTLCSDPTSVLLATHAVPAPSFTCTYLRPPSVTQVSCAPRRPPNP